MEIHLKFPSPDQNENQIFSVNRDGDNTQIATYHNGSLTASGAYNETYNGDMGLSTIIGTRICNDDDYGNGIDLAGVIREMIVFNSPLTDQEINKIKDGRIQQPIGVIK